MDRAGEPFEFPDPGDLPWWGDRTGRPVGPPHPAEASQNLS